MPQGRAALWTLSAAATSALAVGMLALVLVGPGRRARAPAPVVLWNAASHGGTGGEASVRFTSGAAARDAAAMLHSLQQRAREGTFKSARTQQLASVRAGKTGSVLSTELGVPVLLARPLRRSDLLLQGAQLCARHLQHDEGSGAKTTRALFQKGQRRHQPFFHSPPDLPTDDGRLEVAALVACGARVMKQVQHWRTSDECMACEASGGDCDKCAAVAKGERPGHYHGSGSLGVAEFDDDVQGDLTDEDFEEMEKVLGSDPIFKDMINDPVFKDMMGVTGAGSGADKGWFGPLPPGLTPEEKKEFHDLEAGLATEVRGAMASEEYAVAEEAWARKSHPKRLSPALQSTQTVGKAGGAKRYGDHKTLRLGVAGGGRVNLKR